MTRDCGVIHGLKASAEIHQRWSAFKDPEFEL
jgi:hypothetical protein